MATIEFTGHDLVVWFDENPSNQQEWQYRIRYECANETVVHYVRHNEEQSTNPDGMRRYRDVLTFEENLNAGLTRSPKVFLATQAASGAWTDDAMELEIDALNPAPAVPPMSPYNGYDMMVLNFTKPNDTDWAGFVVWADTQTPVRKEYVTSKYEGPNNTVTLPLAPDTKYYITYAAYDAFGTDLLNETTIELTTLSKESLLLPVLNERLKPIEALAFKQSSAFTKLAKAYNVSAERSILRAEERIGIRIDEETGALEAYFDRELEAAKDGLYAGLDIEQKARVSADEAIVTSVTTLNAAVESDRGTFQAALQEERTTRATEDEALSTAINLLGAKLTTDTGTAIESAITEERTARVTADEALTLRLDQQASKIGQNEANFADQIQTLVNADGALSLRITNQQVQWNSDISGAILAATQTINQNIANGDYALSQRIDQATAQFGGFTSSLQSEAQARADADGALGRRIDAISVTDYSGRIATIEQNMSVQTDRVNGLRAQYTLRIDNAGKISGFGLASDPNGNSEFAVNADRFLIAHPGGSVPVFEVVSGQVRIKQAVIANAEITNANIQNLTIAGDKFENKATFDFGGYFANLNGWQVSSTVWNPIGGTVNPARVTLTTGNGDNEVILQLNATYARDGGDDDNLNLSILRSDGVTLSQIHTDIQVQSGKRTMAATFYDPTPGTNTTYTYTARQQKLGSDGAPYWYNTAFWGVVFKK